MRRHPLFFSLGLGVSALAALANAQFESWDHASVLNASAQDESAEAPGDQSARNTTWQAWRDFVSAQRGRDWSVDWSKRSQTPTAIFGPGLRLSHEPVLRSARARELGRQALERYAKLLGRGQSQFVLRDYAKVNRMHVLVYDQKYRGLPVIDGRADIRLHDNGVLSLFGSQAFAIPKGFVIKAKVSAEEAARSLDANIAPRLVIWASKRGKVLLAWEVTLSSFNRTGHVYLDAQSGDELEFRNHICTAWPSASPTAKRASGGKASASPCKLCTRRERSPLARRRLALALTKGRFGPLARVAVVGDVKAWLSTAVSPNGPLQNLPLGGARVQVQGGGQGFTDASGKFSIAHTGTQPVQVTVTFDNAKHVGRLTTGVGSVMRGSATLTPGKAQTIQINTRNVSVADRAQSNAYYLTDRVSRYVRNTHILGNNSRLGTLDRISVSVNNSQARCNAFYGQNQVVFGPAQSGQCPNMAFSTVVEHEWGHGLDDIFGGVSNSDGLGEGYADVVTNYYTAQPIIGKDFQGAGRHVRDATNRRRYPSGQGPHQQGESWMGACWKLRQALIQKLGTLRGTRHAETIVIGSIVADAKSQTAAAREVYLADDNDGKLNNGTPNCRELFAAFTTVHNIPSPVRSCSANPGIFTAFGAGCQGTGSTPGHCQTLNTNGGTLVTNAPTGRLAYAVVASKAMSVNGIELYTKAPSGNSSSGTVSLHRDSGGQPAASAASSGTMSVAGAGWYRASMTSSLAVKSGERYWIVHDVSQISVALVASGTAPKTGSRWNFGQGWFALPPTIPDRPAWRVLCASGGKKTAVPILSSQDIPEIGKTMRVDLARTRASAPAVFEFGASTTTFGAIKLPFDLTPIGAKGCTLYTSIDLIMPVLANAKGEASLNIPFPNSKALVGVTLHTQGIVADKPANALGLAFSNAATMKIGTP